MKFTRIKQTILYCFITFACMACASSSQRHVRSRSSAGTIAGGPTATRAPMATSTTQKTSKSGSLTLTA